MKTAMKWMCGVSALALLTAAPVRAENGPSAPWSWTGYYVGTHLGSVAVAHNWERASGALQNAVPFAGQFTGGGVAYGVQAGYNYQVGRTVLGLEAEASFADIDGPARCGVAVFVCNATIDALGTITGRVGQTYDRFLIYGKAGAAWLHEKVELVPTDGGVTTDVYHGDTFRWGWVLGAGFEYALSQTLSAKVEYNYLNFDNSFDVTSQSGGAASLGLRHDMHLLKIGLNARLGSPAGPAHAWNVDGAPVRDWSGWYAGVHAAGALGKSDWTSVTGAVANVSDLYFPGAGWNEGLTLGGQIGFNRQAGHWVFGGEADIAWTDIDGYAKCAASLAGDSLRCRTHTDMLATVSGRLGWASGNLLFYGKAGAAWAKSSYSTIDSNLPNVFAASSVRTGYVVGSGVDYAFSSAWSGRLEYNYIDFGTRTLAFADQFGNASAMGISQHLHLFKVGLNYRLGAEPDRESEAFAKSFVKAPPRSSDWLVEAGARYWFSSGKSQQDLYAEQLGGLLNSRLIYGGMTGHSGEAFLRADHRGGFFAKANFGAGVLPGGTLNDEDFPPGEPIYSNTEHDMKDGSLRYGSLDLGYNVIDNPYGRLGAFAGYRYFHQRGRGFGCTQIANGAICAGMPPNDTLGLTETEEWRGVAVGLNARLALSQRLTLDVEAAYLPYVDRAGTDNHWNRADINPGPETGRGWGTQVEAVLSYAVTDRLNVGVGGRYWFMTTTTAGTQFPQATELQPIKFTVDRYGGFLQASYKIGGPETRTTHENAQPVDWTGLYAGAHIGAGFGRSDWADPFPAPPTGDRVLTGGALGGLQLGYNYQAGRMVYGAEVAGTFGRLEGSETCFGGLPGAIAGLNCENRVSALGTLTGRVGYTLDRSLFYAKAGAALADQRYTLNSQGIAGGSLSGDKATNWGWVAGAGIEHALGSRWSVNLEYQYVDLGSDTLGFTVPAVIAAVSSERVDTHLHITRLGMNYRFP